MIITISREYGAGGSDVGRRLAERLGWALVDNEVVDEVARRAGLPRQEVADREERAPGFLDRLLRALAASAPEVVNPEAPISALTEEQLVPMTEKVVGEAAARDNVVLVGRAAPAVLGQRANAFHVKVVAPLADRVATVMARLQVDAAQAAREIADRDGNRRRYLARYYQRDWADASNYDLVLNTGRLGLEGTVDLIIAAIGVMSPGAGAPGGPATSSRPRSG